MAQESPCPQADACGGAEGGSHEHPVQPFAVARLSDVVPVSVLQTLQTGFAMQHGIPLAIVEPDGEGGFHYITPFDRRVNYTRFCRLLRENDRAEGLCRECDFGVLREMMLQGSAARAQWHHCHLGLGDVAIPIVVAGKVVAAFFSGQKRLEGTEGEIYQRVRELAERVTGLDPEALCDAVLELEPRTEEQMAELAATVQAQAQDIAQLGQDRYNVERRLRQELMLGELMRELARPYPGVAELHGAVETVLIRVRDFYRMRYCLTYGQAFARSPELAILAWAGEPPVAPTSRLKCPTRPAPNQGELTYCLLTEPETIHAFMAANGSPDAAAFGDAQGVICDFGPAEERVTVTVFGPPQEGHTETLVGTGGDDFLERFHFEVNMSLRAARLLLDLEQTNRDKTQFLAQMTHEINAGLQTIVEESEWLEYYVRDLAHLDDTEITEPLDKILSEVLRLGARARSSLVHLRGGMPRGEYKLLKTHPLDRLLATCVEPFRGVANSRNITIRIDDSLRKLPRTAFDWEMMKTVFMNLVDNAVKYSHFNRTIRVYGEADEEWVSVALEDFGLGIPQDEFERIFEPYVRGTQRDPRRFIWGSGLGLAVARDIIETHGGRIEVKSVPTAKEPPTNPARAWENYITTFTVRLPLRQED